MGQIYGVLDKDDVEVEDDDNVSLSENAKSPVVVEAIEGPDDSVSCWCCCRSFFRFWLWREGACTSAWWCCYIFEVRLETDLREVWSTTDVYTKNYLI